MTCPEIERRLSACLDGELSYWTRWKVQHHLRYCDGCRALFRSLAEVDHALQRAAEGAPAPEYVTQAVMRRLPALPPARKLAVGPLVVAFAVGGTQVAAFFGVYWLGFSRGASAGREEGRAAMSAPMGSAGGALLPAAGAYGGPLPGGLFVADRPSGVPGQALSRPEGRIFESLVTPARPERAVPALRTTGAP